MLLMNSLVKGKDYLQSAAVFLHNMDMVYRVGEGHLTHDVSGFHLTGCDGKLDYSQPPQASYSLYADYYWYEMADCVCIGDTDVHYFLFPKDPSIPVAKVRLACEEMFKLHKAKKLPQV